MSGLQHAFASRVSRYVARIIRVRSAQQRIPLLAAICTQALNLDTRSL
jgi:hypothetical protein